MSKMLNWWIGRLREPSTWRGIIWILTAAGVSLSPDAWQYITTMGMAAAGLIGVMSREDPSRVDIHLPPVELIGRTGMADTTQSAADRYPAADQLRQPVPPVDYPVKTDDDRQSPGWNG